MEIDEQTLIVLHKSVVMDLIKLIRVIPHGAV